MMLLLTEWYNYSRDRVKQFSSRHMTEEGSSLHFKHWHFVTCQMFLIYSSLLNGLLQDCRFMQLCTNTHSLDMCCYTSPPPPGHFDNRAAGLLLLCRCGAVERGKPCQWNTQAEKESWGLRGRSYWTNWEADMENGGMADGWKTRWKKKV